MILNLETRAKTKEEEVRLAKTACRRRAGNCISDEIEFDIGVVIILNAKPSCRVGRSAAIFRFIEGRDACTAMTLVQASRRWTFVSFIEMDSVFVIIRCQQFRIYLSARRIIVILLVKEHIHVNCF